MLKGNLFTTFYSKDDIELIHESVLRVFNEVGVKFEYEEALELFKKHGARVEGDLVFIPEELLNKALSTIPESFEIVGPESKLEIGIGKGLVVAPTNGCPNLEDWDGNYRQTNADDLENFYKIINTSDVYGISSQVAADIPGFENCPTESALAQMAMRSTPDGRGGFFQGTALLLGNENIGLVGNRDFLHFRQKPVWVFGSETELLGRVDDVGLADTRQGSDFALDF